MNLCDCVRQDDYPAIGSCRKGSEGALDLGGVMDRARYRFYSQAESGLFSGMPERLMDGSIRMEDDQRPVNMRCGFF